MNWRWVATTAVLAVVATDCSAAVAGRHSASTRTPALSRRTTGFAPHPSTAGRLATTDPSLTAAPLPGWHPLTRDGYGVVMDRRSFRLGSGVRVVVVRFRAGQASFVLHAGSVDPGWRAYHLGVTARSAVRGAGRSRLVAAFTGGFYLSTGSGGYVQERHVVAALQRGLASLVIDAGGAAHVGIWGHGLPMRGERVFSVRQNLPPLVLDGRPSTRASDFRAWGATLGGGSAVARCALGEDKAGNLLFAAAMSVTPSELAQALVRAGARTAMELDINPEWVQLDYAHTAGGPLLAGIPGQYRPADQYLRGWTRDFVAVEVRLSARQ